MATRTEVVVAAPARRSFAKRAGQVLGPDWVSAWLFFAPTAILLFALVAYPFVQGFYIGFTNTLGSRVTIGPWVGLKNYTDLLSDPDFWDSLRLTIKFTVLAELFKPTLGIIAALLIHNLRRNKSVISALILLPWIVPAIVQALIWRAMFNPVFGALNYVAIQLGI